MTDSEGQPVVFKCQLGKDKDDKDEVIARQMAGDEDEIRVSFLRKMLIPRERKR